MVLQKFLSQCSDIFYTVISVLNAVLPKGSKVMDILGWFSAMPLTTFPLPLPWVRGAPAPSPESQVTDYRNVYSSKLLRGAAKYNLK